MCVAPTADRAGQSCLASKLVGPQVHRHHDQALIVLSGEGNVGLGTTGYRVQVGSLVLVPAGLPCYMLSDSAEGTLALLIAGPPVAETDVELQSDR